MLKNELFIFSLIFLLYGIGYVSHALYLHKVVYGDGIYYYSWLHSIVVDRDFNFSNEYTALGGSQPYTPKGFVGNKYSIGTAFFWIPGYLFLYTLLKGTGFEFHYQCIVGYMSVLSCITGLVLLHRLLARMVSKQVNSLVILTIAFATHLFFYGSLDPINSHSISFFAVMVFLTFLLGSARQWFFIGISLGFIALIRPQDMIYGILTIPYLKKKNIFPLCVGFLLLFFPQMFVWWKLYGNPLLSPYFSSGEFFYFFHPHVFEVLFGQTNGLFMYSPILLLGFIGFLMPWSSWKIIKPYCFTCIIIAIYSVSTWSTWLQGASYSGRMFISILPLFSFALAYLYEWCLKSGWDILSLAFLSAIPFSILNAVCIFFFLASH